MIAIGVSLSSWSLEAETKTTAAAPSDSVEEFGAVTVPVPSVINAGLTARSFSMFSYPKKEEDKNRRIYV